MAGACCSVPDREDTKAAQLDAVAASHCDSNSLEHCVHDFLDVVLAEIGLCAEMRSMSSDLITFLPL
jgi:hypothetical protein